MFFVKLRQLVKQADIFLVHHKKSVEVDLSRISTCLHKWRRHPDVFVTEHDIVDGPKHRLILHEVEQHFLLGLISHTRENFLSL